MDNRVRLGLCNEPLSVQAYPNLLENKPLQDPYISVYITILLTIILRIERLLTQSALKCPFSRLCRTRCTLSTVNSPTKKGVFARFTVYAACTSCGGAVWPLCTLHVCVCVCVSMSVYVCIYVCMYVCVCVYICVRVCVYMWVCVSVYMGVCVCV